MTPIAPPPLVVVMGISGTGKTTVGELVAERLGLTYADADGFHPQANIDKMSSGQALDDADRWPWLEAIGAWLAEHRDGGGVVSCSALRPEYRAVITRAEPRSWFLHLDGDLELIRERMSSRKGHFMPPALLQSQQDTLVPLEPDEPGRCYDVARPPQEIVDAAVADLAARADGGGADHGPTGA